MFASCIYSEYGFAEKVVEGMSVRINSITIKVQARAFHASFELWQLQGNSLNPKWQRSDLRNTRIPDPKRGEVQCRRRLEVIRNVQPNIIIGTEHVY